MSLRLVLAYTLTLALGSTLAAGCYYEDHCVDALEERAPVDPGPGIRNPYSGQCEYYGGGGGGSTGECDDFGGNFTEPAGDRAPLPDWGVCDGFCETLAEEDCLQAAECRAAYADPCADGITQCELVEPAFYECWAVTPGGGYSEDGCNTYDADECSRHNECSAVHTISGGAATGALGPFAYCVDEAGSTDPGSCSEVAECAMPAPDCPEGTVAGVAQGCWTGYCIPLDECDVLPVCSEQTELQCINQENCEPVYEGLDCTCDGEDCTCAEWVFKSCS